MLGGMAGAYADHLAPIGRIVGLRADAHAFAAMGLLQLPRHTVFVCDPFIHRDPSADEIAEMTVLAAMELRRFGQVPRAALLSHADDDGSDDPSVRKMRAALARILELAPELEVEGGLQADTALSRAALARVRPGTRLTDAANLLVMPNRDAANITFNALKVIAGQGVSVGPILLGAAKPAHILTPATTVRGIVNMTTLAAAAG